jgi:hypothetical protein
MRANRDACACRSMSAHGSADGYTPQPLATIYRPDLSQVPCGLIVAWPKLFGDGAAFSVQLCQGTFVDVPQGRAADSELSFLMWPQWSLEMRSHIRSLSSHVSRRYSQSLLRALSGMRGRGIAPTICAACHVVSKGQIRSSGSEAPWFPMLAAMTTCVDRRVADLTSPDGNSLLQPDERR